MRTARIKEEGEAYYHVTTRVINKEHWLASDSHYGGGTVTETIFSSWDRWTRTATRAVDEERNSTHWPFSPPFASTVAGFVLDFG